MKLKSLYICLFIACSIQCSAPLSPVDQEIQQELSVLSPAQFQTLIIDDIDKAEAGAREKLKQNPDDTYTQGIIESCINHRSKYVELYKKKK